MSHKTEPVFTVLLAVGLIGILMIIWGIVDRRDLLALGGTILVASSVTAIARLVK